MFLRNAEMLSSKYFSDIKTSFQFLCKLSLIHELSFVHETHFIHSFIQVEIWHYVLCLNEFNTEQNNQYIYLPLNGLTFDPFDL